MSETQKWLSGLGVETATKVGTVLSFDESQPNEIAESLKIGKDLGVPAPVVSKNTEVFRRQHNQLKATNALKGSPKTAKWLQDPVNGPLAKDDVESLSLIEKWFEDYVEESPGALTRAMGRGILKSSASVPHLKSQAYGRAAMDSSRSLDDLITEEMAKVGGERAPASLRVQAQQIAKTRFDNAASESEVAEALSLGANELADARAILDRAEAIPMDESATRFRDEGLSKSENSLVGVLGAFADDPAGGASFVMQAAAEVVPNLLAATATTAMTRSPALGVTAMSGGTFLMENTSSAMEFLDDAGADLSTPEAALSVLQDQRLMQTASERGVTRGLVIAAMDAMSGGVAGQTLIKSPAGDVIAQGIAQVAFGSGGEAAAQFASGQELDWRDIVIEGLAELTTAPIEVGGVAGRSIIRRLSEASRSGETQTALSQLDELVDATNLKGRSQDKLEDFMAQIGAGDATLYVPADDLKTLFQARDISLEDAAEFYGFDLANWLEQDASGGDVAIPASNYAARISGTEDAAWFHDHATFTPGEMSIAQAEEFNAQISEIMADEFERIEAQREAEQSDRASDVQIYDDIRSQLRAAGRTKSVAEAEASVWSSFWRAMGDRYGADPLSLAESMGVSIRGPQATNVGGITFSQDKRGSINLPRGGLKDGETVISLFESANLSTFLHESGHFFLEAFWELATSEGASEAMRQDLASIQKYLGAEGKAPLSVEQHENWARGFEAYAMEGRAPSLELVDAFYRFKAWLTRIYQSIRGLNVKLTPEIREVMDRMLATDSEIAAAREVQEMQPLFKSAPAGMSDAAWATYQRMARRSSEEASQKLLDKTMTSVRRRTEKWWKAERAEVRSQVSEQIKSRPEHRLVELLANQHWDNEAQDAPDMRIDRQALVDQFGEGVLAEISRTRLGGKRAIYGYDGESPSLVAEFFGFDNSTHMIETLQNTGKLKEAIETETDRIMLDRYGDPLSDGSIEEEALAAIHSEQQAKTVAAEARHLADKAGRPVRNLTSKEYRQRAKAMMGRMSVREAIRAESYLAASRRAAKRAEDAFAKSVRSKTSEGDLASAARFKEQQLLNHYLYLEARDLKEEVAKGRERMQRYSKKSVREKLEGGYIEQIDAILDDYDFRVRGIRQVERSESLKSFVDRMIEEGREAELAIDERLIRDANKMHYTRLSVGDLRGLFDTIQNIDHLGRHKQKLIEAKRRRDLMDAVETVSGQVKQNHKVVDRDAPRRGLQFLNLIRRPDTILISMDGGKEMGPVYDHIKRSVDEGQTRTQEMSVEMVQRMDNLFADHYDAKTLREMQKPLSIPGEVMREWTKAEIVAVALNTGNEDNFQRLMDPKVHPDSIMTQPRLDTLLARLDKNDWAFVQAMWQEIDSLWPDLAGVHRRRTGVEPEKVKPKMMVSAPSGVTGGYYPIQYDVTRGHKAVKDEATAWDKYVTAGHKSTTAVANGMTKQREKSGGGRTLDFDLSVPFQHMRDTIRYIALSEAVDASHKILNHPVMVETMQSTGQMDTLKTLNLWLKDTAQGPIHNTDLLNTSARFLKNNFTLSRLAFNMKTVILQATGLGQSAAVIGKRNMVRGVMAYLKAPAGMISDVVERSAFMAERQTTFQKDIYDFINDTKTVGPMQSRWQKGKNNLAKLGFLPMIKMQFLAVDMPTWLGAYDRALSEGKADEDAVHFADRMVARAQDSGLFADRSGVERGTVSENVRQAEFIKLFTTLAGYMLTKNNRAQVTLMQARAGLKDADGSLGKLAVTAGAASDLLLLFAFEAAMMGLIYALMTDDEDEEDLRNFMIEETGMAVVGGVPVIRDAASAFRGFGGGGVYGSVLEMPAKLAVQVGQGENDKALRRAVGDVVGTVTGLPSTATLRAVEGLIDDDTPASEAIFGVNPLTR